jgi:hypothetical protein
MYIMIKIKVKKEIKKDRTSDLRMRIAGSRRAGPCRRRAERRREISGEVGVG